MEKTSRPRSIIHLDADAFFASCEIAADPSLRGKPVAVGGTKRGIIASANYEARRMGVNAPMPTSQAMRCCPDLVVIPGNYERYEYFSDRMFALLGDYTPFVEIGSIDEGYGDFSGLRQWSPPEAAQRLRNDIEVGLGLSVSMGLASSKLVASIASKLRKPGNFMVVPLGAEREFLAPLAVKWLPGVGPKMESTMKAAGLNTIADVASAHLEILVPLVGSHAPRLRELAMGVDDSRLVVDRVPAKSYARQETFGEDIVSVELARRVLRAMADELMGRVRSDGKMVRCVEVRVRHPDMSQVRRSETFAEPTDLETDLYGTMDALLSAVWAKSRPVRLVGLKLSQVYESTRNDQGDLDLPGFSRAPRRTLAALMDRINEKYGDGTVVRGHRL